MNRIIQSPAVVNNYLNAETTSSYYYRCEGNVDCVGEPCTSCQGLCTGYELECPLCGSPITSVNSYGKNNGYYYACGTVVKTCINSSTGREVPYEVDFASGHELSTIAELDDVI